jgi:stage IV sporulation protein FB
VFFGLPSQTRYDLTWRMFGTNIRVTPFFWLVAVMIGFPHVHDGIEYLLIWVAVVFVSILVHEFGHILVGRHYGSAGHIVLHGLGGLAIGSNNLSNRWQRIAVSLGGPGAQLLLLLPCLALMYLSQTTASPLEESLAAGLGSKVAPSARPPLLDETLDMLIFVNLFWPLLNLMPIWPLDGGQVCRELFQMRMPGTRGQRAALITSMITAGVLALFMLLGGKVFPPLLIRIYRWTESTTLLEAGLWVLRIVHPVNAVLFGLLAALSYLQLRQLGGGGGPGCGPPQPRQPWQSDPDWWKKGRRSPWDA